MRFVTHHDPNQGINRSLNWPKYSSEDPTILEFLDGDVQLRLAADTYRQTALAYDADAAMHNPF